MICKKCGEQIPDTSKFCPKCGEVCDSTSTETNNAEELDLSAAGVECAVPRSFSAKKNIIIIIIAAILLIGGGVTAIALVNSHSATSGVTGTLQLAERFLNEQNYEQAVIEYQKVLEIEPMNVDAYLGLADAYIGIGDTDKAVELLREGLEKTDDERIKSKLDELTRKPEVSSSGTAVSSAAPVSSTTVSSTTSSSSSAVSSTTTSSSTSSSTSTVSSTTTSSTTSLSSSAVSSTITSSSTSSSSSAVSSTTTSSLTSSSTSTVSSTSTTSSTAPQPTPQPAETVTILGVEYDIATTTNLTLFDQGITDEQLKEITKLTNLTELYLNDNQISDITPLAELTSLRRLELNGNKISDITPLSNLTDLILLGLGDNQISDVTPLSKLANLSYLRLSNNQISDITPLAQLTNLTKLDLDANAISYKDIEQLRLQLPNCAISAASQSTETVTILGEEYDIETTTYLGICYQYITDEQLKEIAPEIAKLTNLTELDLSDNRISDITPLANLTNLTNLCLYNNRISDITPLVNLSNLTILELAMNQISDITPLAKLTNLTELYLYNNPFSYDDVDQLQEQLPNCYIST